MKWLLHILLLITMPAYSQLADTLNGFDKKISGDEISYFSPLHQFAKVALLTRVNGEMPISWESPLYNGKHSTVTYEFLLGHSTGTSSGIRHFEVALNNQPLFIITTPMKQQGHYELEGHGNDNSYWHFVQEEYDVNGDAFGRLFITVPAALVQHQASFRINGPDEKSRDWLMIFLYHRGLKLIAQPTSLVTRGENRRQLNVFADNPYASNTPMQIKTANGTFQFQLAAGYNKMSLPAYEPGLTGIDTIQFIINNKDTVYQPVTLASIHPYIFHIIHHSHNDIGYSQLQPEVAQIQNRNISAAIRWIYANKDAREKPVWHIESLWAVENFLRTATPEITELFVEAIKRGQLVLSANYANILTGLCQPEELNWVLEYSRQLEQRYGIRISNGMITDIPGISRSGLLSYVNNNIPYLSLGPNYVDNMPDKGDRVGSVIKDQGDKVFYWKPDPSSPKKLLVWTAGKGYSYFHGITDSEKKSAWEKRISEYCNELAEENYPYDLVQLRYTKNSDNGPVDTMLTSFVEDWNKRFITPQLHISSVDRLFSEFENKYGSSIPVKTGEISPYWEDGAYSTAIEEMQVRQLVRKTLALERFTVLTDQRETVAALLYQLHRNIVLFHEHTWGAWCSISDPEIPFTTEQWRIKKQFLDSAQYYYDQSASKIHFRYTERKEDGKNNLPISDYAVDPRHGGLLSVTVNGKNIVSQKSYLFFEPVYALSINPTQLYQMEKISISTTENSTAKKITVVKGELPSMKNLTITYILDKKEKRLTCHYSFDKAIEKNKESLHIALPLKMTNPSVSYGSPGNRLYYNKDQLPGSNKEFVCAEENVQVNDHSLTATISSPGLALYEIGGIIDENKINGAKVWKRSGEPSSLLFVYVFNNYWHTNYKAYQEGKMEFDIDLNFKAGKN